MDISKNRRAVGRVKRPIEQSSLIDENLSKIAKAGNTSISFDTLPDDVLLQILTLLLQPDSALKMLRTVGSASRRLRRLCFSPMFWGADALVMLLEPRRIRKVVSLIPNASSQITSAALTVRAHSHAISRGLNPSKALTTCIRALAEVCQLAIGITKVSFCSLGSHLPLFTYILPKLRLQSLCITESMLSEDNLEQLFYLCGGSHRVLDAFYRCFVMPKLGLEVGPKSKNDKEEDMTLLLKKCSGLTELSAHAKLPRDPQKMFQLARNMLLWFPHLSILDLAHVTHTRYQFCQTTPSLDLSFLSSAGSSIVSLKLAKMNLGCLSALNTLSSLKSLILIDCGSSCLSFDSPADEISLVNSGVSSITVQNRTTHWHLNVNIDTCSNLCEVALQLRAGPKRIPSVTIDNCASLKAICIQYEDGTEIPPPLPVSVSRCPSITAVSVPTLPRHVLDSLTLLHFLQLVNTVACSVSSLIKEAPFASRLTSLALVGCDLVDDGSEVVTLALPVVKVMDLTCKSFPSTLRLMCPRLESLSLDYVDIVTATEVDLSGCSRLKTLDASLYSTWDLNMISKLPCATSLTSLTLNYCSVTCYSADGLRLPVLQSVDMVCYQYPPVLIFNCPDLETLDLQTIHGLDASAPITTTVSIFGCSKLESITIENNSSPGACFRMPIENAISVAMSNRSLKGNMSEHNLEALLKVIPDTGRDMFKQIFLEGLTARLAITLLALDKSAGLDPKCLLAVLDGTERGEVRSFCERWLSAL